MSFILRTGLVVVAALSIAGSAHAADLPPKTPITVKIVGFNDYHGNLQSPGSFGASIISGTAKPAGGADYLGAYVGLARAANPNLAVVGAGDFIGATPLISALFFDEPAVETLNKIGMDFIGVGNHEFDKGKAELKRLQAGGCKITNGSADPNSCKGFGSSAPGSFDGARYKWLSANVIDDATGRTLLPPYGIKTFNGVRVAFVGMTLKGTPQIVTPTGVAGLSFKDEAATVNALVPRLRALGVETIVVLVHQGGFQNLPPTDQRPADLPLPPAGSSVVNANDINGCMNNLRSGATKSDIKLIVEQLDDEIDLVISGHTHAAYNCSKNTVDVYGSRLNASPNTVSVLAQYARQAGLPNKSGRLIPVTSASAFGRVITEVDLQIDPTSRGVVDVSPVNKVVDRSNANASAWVSANPELTNVVAAYNTAVSPLANAVIGTTTVALSNTADSNGTQPAGDLIADAQLAATQPAGLGNAVMAFMNPGGVRSPGFPAGNVTYGQAFTVQPFGNSLVTMTLTALQIKNLLEQQFAGCLGQGTQRILQISNGLKYEWSAGAAPCSKVRSVVFTPTTVPVGGAPAVSGSPVTIVDNSGAVQAVGPFRVTVNNFLATGGDGFTTLVGGTSVLGGAQDIDALVAYLAQFNTTAGGTSYDPAAVNLGKPRIARLP
jgi:5'-nucleotidase